ncbi:hypothetical protein PBI_MIMI_160 [Arthrobacter phage Mimi]|nr:hypothetical protein PBI_MIMI_240 [Arthrobacter phage Mimi]
MASFGHNGTPRPSLVVDETGKTYGELTVISRGTNSSNGSVRWLCICTCGSTTEVLGYSLRRGKSTRCSNCSKKRDRRTGTGAFRKAYNAYTLRSRRSGVVFPLSLEEFTEIVSGLCNYCGELPTTVRRAYNRPSIKGTGEDDTAVMHGIDRVDSSKPYLKTNIVPCCFVCNRMKSDFGVDFFLNHVKKISNYNERTVDDRT